MIGWICAGWTVLAGTYVAAVIATVLKREHGWLWPWEGR